MTEPYLIAHKVRGELAWDIAEYHENSAMWIVSTSGHRAYPIVWKPLNQETLDRLNLRFAYNLDSVPDHYACNKPQTIVTPAPRHKGMTTDDLLI